MDWVNFWIGSSRPQSALWICLPALVLYQFTLRKRNRFRCMPLTFRVTVRFSCEPLLLAIGDSGGAVRGMRGSNEQKPSAGNTAFQIRRRSRKRLFGISVVVARRHRHQL